MSTSPILDIQAGHPNLADVCCPPLLREPISASQAADLARLLKARADPTRLRLVSMVAAHEGGEACVCELTEPLGLPSPPSRRAIRLGNEGSLAHTHGRRRFRGNVLRNCVRRHHVMLICVLTWEG